MTTKELRAYIDRTLGNSIRCLLPSYWWKRIFGLIVDEVEGKASKESVATLEKKVENFKGGGVQAITLYPLDRSTKQSYHRQVYDTLVELAAKGEDFIVYAEVGTSIYPATTIFANPLSDTPSYGFSFRGWVQTEIHQGTKTEKEHFAVTLFADGTMQLNTTQDYVIDHVISETSTNAVQNKAIKAYVDEQVAKAGGSIDTSNLVTKEELAENEAVYASAITDLNTRLAALEAQLTNN